MTAPSGTLRRPCSRSTLKCSSTSPSISSLTRKPKPRVASNHLTRPVTDASSACAGSSSDSIVGPAPSSARLYKHAYHRVPLTLESVSANRLSVGSSGFARARSSRSTSAPGGMRGDRVAPARSECPARTIAAIAFSRCRRVGLACSRTGRCRRRSAKRSAERTASPSACSRAARCRLRRSPPTRSCLVQPPLAVAAAAQRSRPCRARKPRRRHSRARRSARRAHRDRARVRRPSRARGACARGRRSASRGWSQSGRHSAARAPPAASCRAGGGARRARERVIAPFLCHTPRPSGKPAPQRGAPDA